MEFVVSSIARRSDDEVEIVERKGIGHPDTICDALAEELSTALSRFYLERFGSILHHNVDKVLLRGGCASARFGGGEVLSPIDVYLAGRAVSNVRDVVVPVEEIAIESARAWFRRHLHALDAERHVNVHCLVRPGSADLAELYSRRTTGVPLANDTSFGVGYAPLSPFERLVLDLEEGLNSSSFVGAHPAHGEDVKIMAIRRGANASLTIARAFVAAHTPSLAAYLDEKRLVESHVATAAAALFPRHEVRVNAADSSDGSSVYLTVTGTSAEAGDDGEVGRGNRANGLITPNRPMSLEALAGKNSVTHVGKLYNIVARAVAEKIVAEVPAVRFAECYLVSRIGAPIDDPMLGELRIDADEEVAQGQLEEIARAELANVPLLWRQIIDGSVRVF